MFAKSDFGIEKGDVVMLEDSEIGVVDHIEKITRDSVLFVLEINNQIQLTKDSKFFITNSSLLGDNFMLVNSGKYQDNLIKDGDLVFSILRPNFKLDSLINTVMYKLDSANNEMQ